MGINFKSLFGEAECSRDTDVGYEQCERLHSVAETQETTVSLLMLPAFDYRLLVSVV